MINAAIKVIERRNRKSTNICIVTEREIQVGGDALNSLKYSFSDTFLMQ